MRIAFDLDDTLISPEFPAEECPWYRRILLKEKLRRGTKQLFRKLENHGHEIWIYTTSCRSETYISHLFRAYGLKLAGIVNQDRHNRLNAPSSKYPPAFEIDVLIDDSPGVEQEGRTHGFKTITVLRDNQDWVNDVLKALKKMALTEKAQQLAGTALVGYVLYGQDNGSHMYYNAKGLKVCSKCGYKVDPEYVNPELRIRKRNYDFSYTYDGCCIVSLKFKEFCDRWHYTGLIFKKLPSDPDFFYLIVEPQLQFDSESGHTKFENLCPECGNYESVCGVGFGILKNISNPLPDAFFRTDLSFASGNEKSPLMIVGIETLQKLEKEKISGLCADDARIKNSLPPKPEGNHFGFSEHPGAKP